MVCQFIWLQPVCQNDGNTRPIGDHLSDGIGPNFVRLSFGVGGELGLIPVKTTKFAGSKGDEHKDRQHINLLWVVLLFSYNYHKPIINFTPCNFSIFFFFRRRDVWRTASRATLERRPISCAPVMAVPREAPIPSAGRLVKLGDLHLKFMLLQVGATWPISIGK